MKQIKIRLLESPMDDFNSSKFFGSPVVSKSIYYDLTKRDTREMFFFQIRLEDLKDIDGYNLPKTGYLYAFLNMDVEPYTIRTIYSEDNNPDIKLEDYNEPFMCDNIGNVSKCRYMKFMEMEDTPSGVKLFGEPKEKLESPLFLQFDPNEENNQVLTDLNKCLYVVFNESSDLNKLKLIIK